MKDLRMICVTSCPEIEAKGCGHCVEWVGEYIHSYVEEHGCCPAGNIPYWVPLVGENK